VEPAPGDPTDHSHSADLDWRGKTERLPPRPYGFLGERPFLHAASHGPITLKDILDYKSGPTQGRLTFTAEWISPDGIAVVTEIRTLTFYAAPKDGRMFDVDLRLRANRDLTFEDNDDTVIGMRLSPAFDEKNGGRPVNAQGLIHPKRPM